jgi:hypothetical protein
MAYDPTQVAHQEWLGYVQPVGLVVSTPALLEAQAAVNRNDIGLHRRFLSILPADREGDPVPEIRSFLEFAVEILEWRRDEVSGAPGSEPLPDDLSANLYEDRDILRPTYAVRDLSAEANGNPWLLLVQELLPGTNLDKEPETETGGWHASPQARFERLLRETGVAAGVLFNHRAVRLVYAPRGESSGYITFEVEHMVQVSGRLILSALHMLLHHDRLNGGFADEQRLPALLANSRRFQNLVSTKLAEQVLEALYDLLRGFQAADDQTHGRLLGSVLRQDPAQVYNGLLTVLLRFVFVLYAEDRDLLSDDPVYLNHYSLGGLHERLREDAARYPDTMDQRYGAWAHAVSLFRLVWKGASHGKAFSIPGRSGYLFDPESLPVP